MATIAVLNAMITSDTRGLIGGLRDAQRQTRKTGQTIRRNMNDARQAFGRVTRSVVNFRTAIGVLAGSAGIGLLIRNQMQAIDQTAKFADMIGVATEELEGLQHAAEVTAGVTDSQFNQAFQRMTRRIAEAAQGTGEATDAIRQLGLDAEALNRAGPAEAFRQIATAMQRVDTQGERVRIAFKLFDSEGAKLVNTLSAGAGEINRLTAEAEELGIAFSRVDAAQVEAANDAITRMSAAVTGVTRELAIQLAPVVAVVGDRFVTAMRDSEGAATDLRNSFVDIPNALAVVVDAAAGVERTFQVMGRVSAVSWLLMKQGALETADAIINGPARAVNALLDLMTSLPGFDLQVELPEFRALQHEIEVTREAVRIGVQDIHDILMEPLPGNEIARMIEKQREAVEAQRREMGAVQIPGLPGQGEGEGTGVESEAERARQRMEARLEEVRRGVMSEREIEQESFWQRMEQLGELREHELITAQEHMNLLESYQQRHQQRLTAIEQAGLTQRQKFQQKSYKDQAADVFGTLGDITAGVAQHNKTLFRMNQAAGIANAIINAYEGISLTMSKYPYPLNIAMAAAHAGAAFAQVQAIRSASFNGAGGAAPSLSGGTAAPPVTQVESVADQREEEPPKRTNLTIRMEGRGDPSRRDVERMFDKFNELIDDGWQLGRVRLA